MTWIDSPHCLQTVVFLFLGHIPQNLLKSLIFIIPTIKNTEGTHHHLSYDAKEIAMRPKFKKKLSVLAVEPDLFSNGVGELCNLYLFTL